MLRGSIVNNDPSTMKPTLIFEDAVRFGYTADTDEERFLLTLEDINHRVIINLGVTVGWDKICDAVETLQKVIMEAIEEEDDG